MKNLLPLVKAYCLSLLLLTTATSATAQQDVFANQLMANSNDLQNASNIVDTNYKNYAHVSSVIGILGTTYARVRFPETRNAGEVVCFWLQSTGATLSASLLSNTTIKLYNDNGVQVATASGTSLLNLSLLVPGNNIYAVKFYTNPTDTFHIREARIEFTNLATINLLNEFRIYAAMVQATCPPVYANSVYAHGASASSSILSGYVNNPNNATDANPNNFAQLVVPLNILSLLPPSYLDMSFPVMGNTGDYVGITVSQASSILNLGLLQQLEIKVYDEFGAVKATKNNFNLLDLKLVPGSSDHYTLGFVTTGANYHIARVRITLTAVVGLLQNVNIYNTFHYRTVRPEVTVNTNGNTVFCQGGVLNLTAVDPLGIANFIWNIGSNNQAITVSQTGVYSVQVTDSASCSRSSFPIAVTVNPKPTPSIIGDSVLCTGETGLLQTVTNFVNYVWSGGLTSSVLNVVNPGKYFVNVIDINGCSNTDSINVIRNILNIVPTITSANCSAGGNNGGVALNVTGGSGIFSYLWNTGSTVPVLNNLLPSIYSATIKDTVHGCSYKRVFTIPNVNTLQIKPSILNTTGCGKTDGKININILGGSGNYTYSWNTGATTANLNNVPAGIYRLYVTDANTSCQVADTFTLSDANTPLLVTPSVTNASGCTTTNGAISLTVTGGSGNYSYTWLHGPATANITGVKAGFYYVKIHDNVQNCNKVMRIQVGVNSLLEVNGSTLPTSCLGATGSINLSVVNGTGNYLYQWSNGMVGSVLNNLPAGTYIANVLDNVAGCAVQKVFSISENNGPQLNLNIATPVCNTAGGASVNVTALTSGIYKYLWSNGAVTKDVFNLLPGNYALTVIDSITNCLANYQVNINLKPQFGLIATSIPNTSCLTAPVGEILLNVLDANGPLSFLWNNNAVTQNLNHLANGLYTVTVQDTNGCTGLISVPILTDSSKLLHLGITNVVNASCLNAVNGAIQLLTTGGNGLLSWLWSNNTAAPNLTGVGPGIYTATVTDALGCVFSILDTIGIDINYNLGIDIDTIISSGCSGNGAGIVNINVTGGIGPFNFAWSNGSTLQNLVNAVAGTYSVTVTDGSNLCSTVQNAITILGNTNPVVAVLDSVKKAGCTGSLDGKAFVSVTGGTPPYTYSWTNGSLIKNLLNVNPGTYTLTASDATGCLTQLSVSIPVDTGSGLKVVLDSVKNAHCLTGTSGAVYITASGGQTPYSYLWSNGSFTPDLVGVVPGIYTVQVTDGKGCVKTATGTPLVSLTNPVQVVLDSVKNAGCTGSNSGKIYIHSTGGFSPYTYSWNTGSTAEDLLNVPTGIYNVVAHDNKGCTGTQIATVGTSANPIVATIDSSKSAGCLGSTSGAIYVSVAGGQSPYTYNWSNNSLFKNLLNVSAGSYNLTITDANGCTGLISANVPVANTNLVTISVDSTRKPTCAVSGDGKIYVKLIGGLPPYTYLWSNGATTKNLLNVNPGIYTLTATDANGCPGQIIVPLVMDTANTLKAVIDSTVGAACAIANKAAIYLTASGGTPPYTYNWSNGNTAQNLLNVIPGIYNVQIVDAKGCVINKAAQPVVNTLNTLSVIVDSVRNAACAANASGAIFVHTVGGTLPYSYLWNNGNTAQTISNIIPGAYNITVNDASGCNAATTATVGINTANLLSLVVDSIKAAGCLGNPSGAIYLHPIKGLAPYVFNWTNNATTQNILAVPNGNYTVTLTDQHLCQIQQTIAVPVGTNSIVVNVDSVKKPSCSVSIDGKAFISVTGGKPPYTYLWNNGSLLKDLLNVNPGLYTLTVKDANLCTATTVVNVVAETLNALNVTIDSVKNAGCSNGNNAAIFVTATGGNLPYTYSWSNGSTVSDLLNIIPGNYNLTVTDAKGCSVQKIAQPIVSAALALNVALDSVKGAACTGSNSGSIHISATSGKAPFSYIWSNSSAAQDLLNVAPGSYNVLVTDAAGCIGSIIANVGIDLSKAIVVTLDSVVGAGCSVGAQGQIFTTITGGKAPFSCAWSNGGLTQHLLNVTPGAYGLQITDANGCHASLNATIPVDANKLLSVVNATINPAACAGSATGSILVNIQNGIAPYSYYWSNGQTTQNLLNVAPSTYQLVVADATGCGNNFTATVGIDSVNALALQIGNVTDARCLNSFSGGLNINVTGGNPPYVYSWSNGAASQDISFVAPGTYTLLATDASGCQKQITAFITIDSSNNLVPQLDSTIAVRCNDSTSGAIYISAAGGVPPYVYLWNNGNTAEDIINLRHTAYNVLITDDAGCKGTLSAIVPEANPITITADVKAIKCFGDQNAEIDLIASNGSGTYQYNWNTGVINKTIDNIGAGLYSVIVEDIISGCKRADTFNITQPDSLALNYLVTKDSCYGNANGSIVITNAGGMLPYSYLWSNNSGNKDLYQLDHGSYTLRITDANLCVLTRVIDVPETDCDFNLNIHNVITPNGDGINDAWVIEGIQYYTDNSVQLFSKWGDKVMEQKNYRNDWKGTYSTSAALPSGTYYYVIKAGGKDYTGYLMIQP